MVEANIKLYQSVSIRRFPYPYRAMLAVCSDLDETPDTEPVFALTMGRGIEDITGNSGKGLRG